MVERMNTMLGLKNYPEELKVRGARTMAEMVDRFQRSLAEMVDRFQRSLAELVEKGMRQVLRRPAARDSARGLPDVCPCSLRSSPNPKASTW